MTSRERMITALRGGTPDRVPCAPDMSNMIPCRLTGKPFYEVYLNQDPPLWKAYIDAVRYFGTDGWFIDGDPGFTYKDMGVTVDSAVRDGADGSKILRQVFHTPKGDLSQETTMFRDNSPAITEGMIKDFEKDYPKLKYMFPPVTGCNPERLQEQKRYVGEDGIFCTGIMPFGLHTMMIYFQGGIESAIYAYYDYPDLFEEWAALHRENTLKMLEIAIDCGIDGILTGGSGSITLQNPEIWEHFSLPVIKEITHMCRQAGVVSGIHSCGKEMHLIKKVAQETELDYVNPLEIPPMGDSTLTEARKICGDLALMGNLHTTNVMLMGSVQDVRKAALQAILDGGLGGAFVLSTGDQCGRDTPEENIREMVRVCETFGRYPIDADAIREELARL